jgi:hypothetical protein
MEEKEHGQEESEQELEDLEVSDEDAEDVAGGRAPIPIPYPN